MLQKIRDRLTGGFAIAILAFLSIPFLFFGINYNFTGSGYAAKVEGVEIPTTQLEQEYQAELARYAEAGMDLPAELRMLVRENVLTNLIRETLINVHTAEEGYRVSDQMVARMIQSVPDFQVDGRFSRDRYHIWLQERGLTPTRFEESQRNALRVQQFQRALGATSFVTPGEYRRYLNLYGEQRRAAIAVFDIERFADEVDVSEGDVVAYYNDNPEQFRTPESADIEYVEIDRAEIARQVTISEARLQEYYTQSSNRYLQDERRQARHILIPFGDDRRAAREQANAIAERARAGEPFEDLARQYSADSGTAGDGGDLGSLMQSQLPDALAGTIFFLNRGEITDPVESEFGFHVVRLDAIEAGGPLPLEQVRGELEAELRDVMAEDRFQNLQRILSDALFDGDSLEEMAAAVDREVMSADDFTRVGGEPFGANQAVIDAVFDRRVVEDGAVSDIVELDANRIAVFKVSEYHEAAQRPLAEVREDIVEQLRAERAQQLARERALELQAELRRGADFATAAAEAGAEVTPRGLIGRQDQNTDARIIDALFRAEKPAEGSVTVGNAVTNDGNQAVFSLSAVLPGRPESIPQEERDSRKERLTAESGTADYTALILELERRAEIVLADRALAAPEF